MQLIDDFRPGTAHGGCYLCHSSRRETETFVVDLERMIDFEGFLMLCQSCATDIAFAMGFMAPDNAAELANENKRLRSENQKVLKQLADKTDVVELLHKLTDEKEKAGA